MKFFEYRSYAISYYPCVMCNTMTDTSALIARTYDAPHSQRTLNNGRVIEIQPISSMRGEEHMLCPHDKIDTMLIHCIGFYTYLKREPHISPFRTREEYARFLQSIKPRSLFARLLSTLTRRNK